MTNVEFAERLAAMKRENWQRFSVAHIHEPKEPWPTVRASEDLTRLVDAYLKHWVPGACPFCGYGKFHWGLVHGSGECTCGWPGRIYHRIANAAGVEVVRFDALFWAHPYGVHVKKETQ